MTSIFFLLCGYETDLLSEQLSSSSAVVVRRSLSLINASDARNRQLNV